MDDEDAVQKLLTYPLRKEGYDVVPALDGRGALERLSEDDFDLVVLDVMMPRRDGFEVCREIRSRSTVPIIMLYQGRDRHGARPRAGRRRLHHQALLGAGVPQPREGGVVAALAGLRSASRSPSRRATCVIDFEKRLVQVRGEAVRLTYVEFEILAALARRSACLQPHHAARARGATRPTATRGRSTSTSVTCVRLESEPKTPELILTVHVVGYRFQDE